MHIRYVMIDDMVIHIGTCSSASSPKNARAATASWGRRRSTNALMPSTKRDCVLQIAHNHHHPHRVPVIPPATSPLFAIL